jgi:NAD(P)-dependent dehydrogenase (short-subunit alcohol dehydrogenase family)
MPTLMITGANRGIGAQLAKNYASDGWQVIAACRQAPEWINDFANAEFLKLDVLDEASLQQAKSELGDRPLDVLWNNAGVYLDKGTVFSGIDYDAWVKTMAVNTMAPLRVSEVFIDNIAASDYKVLTFTSSLMASIERTMAGGSYGYRTSKAALNMAIKCLSVDLKDRGISAVAMDPGWVKTEMGGAGAEITVDVSAAGMKQMIDMVIEGGQSKHNGHFYRYDGTEVPW